MTLFDEPRSQGAARLHEIAASLTEMGWTTHLHRTRAGTDLTAILRSPGQRDVQVIADEDGYTELRYWASLSSPPVTAAAAIADILDAVMASQSLAERAGPTQGPAAGYDGAVTERAEGAGMTGQPHDHLAEQGRIPDQARPHPADNPHDGQVRPDDLQARLERLPLNHPSSPYRDDGSRKPPPPHLTQYEHPLPDESDSPTNPELADEPRTAPDGSWDWKGRHLEPDESRTADEVLAESRTAEGRDSDGNYGEHGLTPAMRRIETQLDHGHLVEATEKFALKDPDRFKEKLADAIARNPDKSCLELATEIHDAIRYTFIFSIEGYTDGMWDAQGKVEAAGYELEVRRNSWSSEEYKGINARWFDPDSEKRFEIQFHTQESWEAKQQTHDAYERMKDPRTPSAEVMRLREFQKQISEAVTIPLMAPDIPEYRREGR
jgi:hypothetical protein